MKKVFQNPNDPLLTREDDCENWRKYKFEII